MKDLILTAYDKKNDETGPVLDIDFKNKIITYGSRRLDNGDYRYAVPMSFSDIEILELK